MNTSPEYRAWDSMKTRCYNPHTKNWARYGGRGITVCERWRKSFQAFLEDMGPRPEGRSLDRIDNNGNYEPGNVRWATPLEQANNGANAKLITFNGLTLSISGWARRLGIDVSSLRNRLRHRTVEAALTDPVKKNRRRKRVPVTCGI